MVGVVGCDGQTDRAGRDDAGDGKPPMILRIRMRASGSDGLKRTVPVSQIGLKRR